MNDFYLNISLDDINDRKPKQNTFDYLEVETDVDKALMQIEVLFSTKPGEVLGNPTFGLDLEQFLNSPADESTVKEYIRNVFLREIPYFYSVPIDIQIQFIEDTKEYRDIMVVNVIVDAQDSLTVFVG
jgi:hypothetical protein